MLNRSNPKRVNGDLTSLLVRSFIILILLTFSKVGISQEVINLSTTYNNYNNGSNPISFQVPTEHVGKTANIVSVSAAINTNGTPKDELFINGEKISFDSDPCNPCVATDVGIQIELTSSINGEVINIGSYCCSNMNVSISLEIFSAAMPDTPDIGNNEPDDGDDGENSCPTDFSNSPSTNNPVQLATGAKQESTHCLTLPYKNAGIKLGLQYDSSWIGYTETRANDIAGPGWTVGHTQRIDVSKLNDAEPQLDYVHSNGLIYPMVPKTGSGSGSAGNITLWLMQDLDDNSANTETSQDTTTQEYTFTQANGNSQTFDANGDLVKSCFASDNTCINYSTSSVSENGTNYEMRSLSLVDNSTSAETQRMEMLIRVSDNKLKIVRDASSQIPAAERREVTFSYNAQGQLSQIVQADGATTSYEYDSEGYLTKKVEPNMQAGSGTEAEGWSIEIDYETTAREVYPKRRVTKETWKDAANNAVRSVVFNWDATGVTIETYDESTTSPTLLTSERNEFDSEGRLTKAYLTDSTTLFTQFEYCDPSTDAVNCPSIQTEALYRRVTAPNGIVTDYSYDAKGNMISNTISDSL